MESKLLLFKTYGPPWLWQVLFKKVQKHDSFHWTASLFREIYTTFLCVFYSTYCQYLNLFNLRNFLLVFFPLIFFFFLRAGSLSLFIKVKNMNRCYVHFIGWKLVSRTLSLPFIEQARWSICYPLATIHCLCFSAWQ